MVSPLEVCPQSTTPGFLTHLGLDGARVGPGDIGRNRTVMPDFPSVTLEERI